MVRMNRRSFLSLAVARPFAQARAADQDAVVETAYGKVRGLVDNDVLAFKGLRYGASTAGERRFLPAATPAPWTGIVDAFEHGPRAPQPFRPMIPEIGDALIGQGPMSEDCLRLDIWTPGARRGSTRPVMVWLHGGGFRTGSGNATFYDGHELARKHDVVVVTVTHRLHALGIVRCMWASTSPPGRNQPPGTSSAPGTGRSLRRPSAIHQCSGDPSSGRRIACTCQGPRPREMWESTLVIGARGSRNVGFHSRLHATPLHPFTRGRGWCLEGG